VSVVHDDIVGDVGVQRHYIVLSGRVHPDPPRAVTDVVVGDGHKTSVLYKDIHHAVECVVEYLPTTVLHVVGLKRQSDVVFSDVLEHETSADVVCDSVVSDTLDAACSCTQQIKSNQLEIS